MSDTPDYRPYLAFAAELAAKCGQIAAETFGQHNATRKSDGTLVTKTDEQIDRLISSRIAARYPGHAILSEEQSTIYDPDDEYTWVVDPVDGTTNFAHGMPIWGVSIALLHRGRPSVGVLDFPLLHEQYQAMLGHGATRSGAAITTSPVTEADDEQLIMKCTRTDRLFGLRSPLKSRIMGSAAYHLCKVADGTAVAGIETTPKVWDLAAAYLIVAEAGGIVVAADDTPIFPLAEVRRDYKERSITTLSAANTAMLQHLIGAMSRRER
jgi:myo-inositol-1(or 4)-monophosphatase